VSGGKNVRGKSVLLSWHIAVSRLKILNTNTIREICAGERQASCLFNLVNKCFISAERIICKFLVYSLMFKKKLFAYFACYTIAKHSSIFSFWRKSIKQSMNQLKFSRSKTKLQNFYLRQGKRSKHWRRLKDWSFCPSFCVCVCAQ